MLHTPATLLLFLCKSISGVYLTIQNAGFETDNYPVEDNTYYYGGSILSDWDLYDPGGVESKWTQNVLNPTGGNAYNDPIFGTDAPEGIQTGYVEQDDNKKRGSGEVGIYQQLADTVTADTQYTLTVYVGNCGPDGAKTVYSKTGTDGKSNEYDNSGFPGYRVQLMAGSTILAEDDDSITVPAQQWIHSTVTVTINAGNTNIGDPLIIRLLNKNSSDGGNIVGFDDVKLEAITGSSAPSKSPTPSPTSNPTPSPTKQPTKGPTFQPTLSPIPVPTETPIKEPTSAPIPDPTPSPSNPTVSPVTSAPVIDTSDPTIAPTLIMKNTEINDGDNADVLGNTSPSSLGNYLPIVIGVVGILSGCFCFCLGFCIYKWMKSKERGDEHVKQMEMASGTDYRSDKNVQGEIADQITEVKSFFEDAVRLPKYYSLFVSNGYDSMRAMLAIRDKEELEEIGVRKAVHQTLILNKINGLRATTEGGGDTTETNVNAETEEQEEKGDEDAMDEMMQRDRMMVKAWFECNIGLAKYKYHELFIASGYESIKAISAIPDKLELLDIGVKIVGHRTLIWSEIQKFKYPQNMQMYNVNAFNGNQYQSPMLPPLPMAPQSIPQGVVPLSPSQSDVLPIPPQEEGGTRGGGWQD